MHAHELDHAGGVGDDDHEHDDHHADDEFHHVDQHLDPVRLGSYDVNLNLSFTLTQGVGIVLDDDVQHDPDADHHQPR